MKEDLKFFKSFKKIEQGKENKGYLEWERQVKSTLTQMSDHNLCNMRKRVYLSLQRCEHHKEEPNLFNQMNCLWAMVIMIFIGLLDFASTRVVTEQMMSFVDIYEGLLFAVVTYFGVLAMRSAWKYLRGVDKELYYAELLVIIDAVIANKKTDDGKKRNYVVSIQECYDII